MGRSHSRVPTVSAFSGTNSPGRCPTSLARSGPQDQDLSQHAAGISRRGRRPGSGFVSLCHHGAIILRGSDKPAHVACSIRSSRPSAGTSLERIAPESLTRNRRRSFTARCRAAMVPRHQIQYADDPDEPLDGLQSAIARIHQLRRESRVTFGILIGRVRRRDIAAGPSVTGQAWSALAAAAGSH